MLCRCSTDVWRIASAGLFLLIAGCNTLETSTPVQPQEIPFSQELQAALDQALRDGQGEYVLGGSAVVLIPEHKLWTGVSGFSHVGVLITEDMLFDAGSIVKNMEAALALEYAEDGLLDLDAPISTWLPPLNHVNSGITVRQLLNHTSGIYNVFEHPDFPWVGDDVEYGRYWTLEEVFDQFVLEPYGPPGRTQHYSSTNYLLLTVILENATKEPTFEAIANTQLKPLGLENSYVSMEGVTPVQYTVAHPWVDVDGDDVLEDLVGTPVTWKASLTHPVLYASPEDLAMWMKALFLERNVLAPEAMEEMLTIPEVTNSDPAGVRYGLGVGDFSGILGMEAIGHGGSALGYNAAALYLPEYETIMVWMINTGESPPELAGDLMWQIWSSLSEVITENLRKSSGE